MKKGILIAILGVLVSLSAFGQQAGPKNMLSNWDVTFYGYLKVDTVYMDAKAYGDNYLVMVPPGNLHDGYVPESDDFTRNSEDPSFSITARQSRFGFRIKGPTFGKDGQVLGRFEGDFYGTGGGKIISKYDPLTGAVSSYNYEDESKGNFLLRIATVELKCKSLSILAGNDWMVMSPLAPHVSNYTAGAEMGNLGYRMPQVRLTGYLMDNQLQIMGSIDNKIGDYNGFYDVDTGDDAAQPDFQGGIMWDSKLNDKPFKLGVTGHYAMEEVTNYGAVNLDDLGNKEKIPSWSWNLHMMLPVTKWMSINGEYFQGANLDGQYTGAQGQGWVVDDDGDFHPLASTGGWGEVELGPFNQFVIYAGYGVDDVDNGQLDEAVVMNNGKAPISSITKNSMAYASVHYWVVPKVADVSLEWMQVNTEYDLAEDAPLEWDNGLVNRYTLSFWFFI